MSTTISSQESLNTHFYLIPFLRKFSYHHPVFSISLPHCFSFVFTQDSYIRPYDTMSYQSPNTREDTTLFFKYSNKGRKNTLIREHMTEYILKYQLEYYSLSNIPPNAPRIMRFSILAGMNKNSPWLCVISSCCSILILLSDLLLSLGWLLPVHELKTADLQNTFSLLLSPLRYSAL